MRGSAGCSRWEPEMAPSASASVGASIFVSQSSEQKQAQAQAQAQAQLTHGLTSMGSGDHSKRPRISQIIRLSLCPKVVCLQTTVLSRSQLEGKVLPAWVGEPRRGADR